MTDEIFDSIVHKVTVEKGLELAAYHPRFIVDQVMATCRFMRRTSALRAALYRLRHRQSARQAKLFEEGRRRRGCDRQAQASRPRARTAGSDLRVEIKEGVEALLELGLDLLARALEHVHGDVCLVAVGQLEGSVVESRSLRPRAAAAFRRQESDLPWVSSYLLQGDLRRQPICMRFALRGPGDLCSDFRRVEVRACRLQFTGKPDDRDSRHRNSWFRLRRTDSSDLQRARRT